ncbi:MAG TPA: RHS repeat-associated core domain-containing protein [Candidatus Sulfotelmatobacter sp.]|nr:RHS repeat-associated core domain-containing protein [Candidatus Sulfotelmatobacter sp.]
MARKEFVRSSRSIRSRDLFPSISGGLRFLLVLAGLLWLIGPGAMLGKAQSYLNSVGVPPFTTALPVERGFINAGNGNLHLVIPLGSYQQRGKHPFTAALVYDSRIWMTWYIGSSNTWQPMNGAADPIASGWSLQTTADTGLVSPFGEVNSCYPYRGTYTIYTFTWVATDGTQRSFPVGTEYDPNGCDTDEPSGSAWATDSSGYRMFVTNYTQATIYAPDGTQVYPKMEDSNGNFFSRDSNQNVIDTLNRTPVTVTKNCNGNSNLICYHMLNSQGQTSDVKVTLETINVDTNFGQSGITEYSGTITVVQSIELPDNSSYSFSYDSGTSPGNFGLLTNMTLPTSGQVGYAYTTFKDAYGNYNRWISNRSVGSGTWTYSPQAMYPCYTTCQQQLTVTKPSGDSVVYQFTLNNGAWNTQIQYYNGSVSSANLLATDVQGWDLGGAPNYIRKLNETITLPVPGGSSINATVKYTYDNSLDSNVTEKDEWKYYTGSLPANPDRKILITYNTNANYTGRNIIDLPTSIKVESGTGTVVAQTNIAYDSGTPSSAAATQHDANYGTGFTYRGNPTEIDRYYVVGSSYLATKMFYDITGQLVKSQDPKNNATTFSYADNFYDDNGVNPPQTDTSHSATNAYLTQMTLPLSGTTTFGYYYGTGKRASSTDPNSADTYQHFIDSLDRLTSIALPITNGNRGGQFFNYTGETEIDSHTSVTTAPPSQSCSGCRHDETLLNGLGQVEDNYLVNDPDGQTTVGTTYDTNERVQSVTNPYRASQNGADTYAYDGLDRLIQVSHTDGTTSSASYGASVSGAGVNATQRCSSSTYGIGFPVLGVDEAGKKLESWTDGFGRKIEVDEPDSSGSLNSASCYAYDLNNNLTQVVSATSQTRTYTYDALSRVLSVAVPETKFNGTQYTTTFSYTTGGSLCSGDPSAVCQSTDPRGKTKTYSFDAQNRVSQIGYSDTTPAVTYCYEGNNTACISGGYSSTDGKGRRTAMSDGSGNTGWSYDPLGRIVAEQRTIAGKTKTISYSYNFDGSIASITYPSGRVVTYSVGDAERALSATDSNGTQYAVTASYAAMGALASVIYGQVSGGFTGTTEARAYNNRMETTGIQASSSNGTAVNLSYCFNPFSFSTGCSSSSTGNNGSVTGISNSVDTNESQTFAYDTLNRIASAATQATSGNDCWGTSFGIDAVANLTGMTPTQCSGGGNLNSSTDGNNHLTGTGYSYDTAGDMTGDGAYTYTYDAENRITSANGVNYSYDGNGMRVEKSSGTLYWRSISGDTLAESDLQGNIQNEYVFFSGRRIARISSGTVNYFYSDMLGTTHTITDSTGNPCYDASFTPDGQEVLNPNISQTCSSNYKFTGYEYDSETGLYYAFARYYNPRLGRFMSADPLGGSVKAPQALNRYAYVVNNPPNFTDPVGLFLCDPDSTDCPNGGGGGSEDGCSVNGIDAPCSLALGLVNDGAAVQCPDNYCGFGTSEPFQCVGDVCGYFTSEYVATHENDWNGVLYSNSEWATFLQDRIEAQREALADAISMNSNLTWQQAYDSLQYVRTQGGNADFLWVPAPGVGPADQIGLDMPGLDRGGCEFLCRLGNWPSIHYNDWMFHLDNVNVAWAFPLGLLGHGLIDVGFGNINGSVPFVH